jgi:hypothetical protein
VIARIAASLVGGYLFTYGAASIGVAGLVSLGIGFHEAEKSVLMLAFPLFLGVFLWAFACASLARVWAVLAGGGALMTAAAWALQRAILG